MQDVFTLSSSILSPNLQSVDDAAHPWHVLRCRPAFAGPLVEHLRVLGLDYFQPLRSVTLLSKDKKTGRDIRRRVERAIFLGYVFFTGTIRDLYRAQDETKKILSVLEVKDQERFRREIRSFEQALIENPRLGGMKLPSKGKKCRVVSGAWLGQEGIVDECGRAFIILRITTLGQAGIPLEITDPASIEVL